MGAAQYVRADDGNRRTCEFAITVAEDWRGIELAAKLLGSLVRRSRRDGYETMEGSVIAEKTAMLALARWLHFKMGPVPWDAIVVRAARAARPVPDGQQHRNPWVVLPADGLQLVGTGYLRRSATRTRS